MYEVAVTRSLVAQHYLTVPDPGPEGELHSHQFTITATVRGPALNEYAYLVDIDALADAMTTVADYYREQTLNDLPEFEGTNPSAEYFATVFADRLLEHAALETDAISTLRIEIEEDDVATVAHQRDLSCTLAL
ncbi:6-pyruvoyl trahydropterin synthase family protein [Natronolimnobius baerhuensis]|uniref:6-pyruvoyl tetrahydropterin synthase n=1 Tax=Natronolimnobius baerhuensis TaxID=253108 RepID=A0A202EDD5_9EURY|nr:6-carboxytetrahydropterin synthase [Natronolimnobius baerhuensis]OVE86252.1 6-pyruvoyl tetrahydropterin synthase [Natronolimnobius baerhuensis]